MRAAFTALSVLLALPSPAWAQDSPLAAVAQTPAQARADALDRLFAQLHVSTVPSAPIEAAIWNLWMANDSATAEVLLQQATTALESGEKTVSLSLLDTITRHYPDFAEGWNKRATLLFMLGRNSESLADIEKVLALEPRHFGALAGRGMILAEQKKYSEALASLREALAINPQLDDVRNAIKMIEHNHRSI